jgi:Matrixin
LTDVAAAWSRSFLRTILLVAGIVASTFWMGSCGSSGDGGVGPVGRTVIFEPAPGDTTIGTLQAFRIRGLRSDGVAVQSLFTVNGGADTTATQWDFVGPTEGQFLLEARATADGVEYSGEWTVTVTDGAVPPTPGVQAPSAVEGPIPGSLDLVWQAPPSSQVPVPLTDYVIAYSEAPFDSTEFDSVSQVVVPHDSNAIVQRAQLTGLTERALYTVRLRVLDILGRRSAVSDATRHESTGHFDLSGVVQAVAPATLLLPLAEVLVEVDGIKSFTDASGAYSLLNLPDLGPRSVVAQEQSGSNYYVYNTSPLDPVTREQPIVLFPQDIVVIDSGDPGVDPVITRLEYFRRLTQNFGFVPFLTNPWQSYPIPFYLGEFTSTSGDTTLSYRQTFLDAIDIWNSAAGELLFQPILGDVDPVANPGLVGARFVADLTAVGGSLLGQVRIVRPVSGELYEDTPEFLEVHMLQGFLNQEIATYVAVHELGHVLGVAHSPNLDDIMFRTVRTQRPDGLLPKPEEVFVARLLKSLPPQTDTRWYTASLPRIP